MRRRRGQPKSGGRIIARYNYVDEQGNPLYQVRRYEPKNFSVHTAADKELDATGKYRRIPYRLPELLQSDPNEIVYVVEGEKDVDRLRSEGLIATCNAVGGGKGKWTRSHSRYLHGRHVVILPDNDATGIEHGLSIAGSINRIAASVRVLELPDLPHKGDVSDWLDRGHTVEELTRLVAATPIWRSRSSPLPKPDWAERDSNSNYTAINDARWRRREIYGLPILPTEKLLLLMLSEYEGPTQEDLAVYLRLTPRRVRQMIQELKNRGYIRTSRRGRRNSYGIDTLRRLGQRLN